MKKAQRPIDLKGMPWSHIGKDALDAAAERLWNNYITRGAAELPYHLQGSQEQELVQRAVLDVMGNAVPAMLRQRAKELKKDGDGDNVVWYLNDLADELENDHG